jgi:N-acetyl-1-D-myo-inositol-2-amino-2-deoxy-alpha-D-glucopyranoside deacetylase
LPARDSTPEDADVGQRRILAAFAHPDDEAFSCAGTLARLVAEGVHVTLVCATRGEVGEISDPALATPETLGEVREGELRAAARAMGLDDVIVLDYRDSGMAGTEENHDPRAFVNAPADAVVRRLVKIIRRERPQVVLTFDPSGGYGHPDHIAIHHHTVAAVHAAATPSYAPDLGDAWCVARLCYSVIPRAVFRDLIAALDDAGYDTADFRRFEESGAGWPSAQVPITLDVSAFTDAKWQALNAHRTQFGLDSPLRRIPYDLMRRMLRFEHYALAWPQSEPDIPMSDLFAGLDIQPSP